MEEKFKGASLKAAATKSTTRQIRSTTHGALLQVASDCKQTLIVGTTSSTLRDSAHKSSERDGFGRSWRFKFMTTREPKVRPNQREKTERALRAYLDLLDAADYMRARVYDQLAFYNLTMRDFGY